MQTTRKLANPIWLFIPGFAIIIGISVIPLVYSVYISLHAWSIAGGKAPGFNYGLNYVWMVTDSRFLSSLGRLVYYSGVGVGVQLILGLIFSTAIYDGFKSHRQRSIVLTLCLTPMIVAPVAAGFSWWMMDHSTYGIVNYLFGMVGLRPVDWLGDPDVALSSVMIADIWQWSPFITLILYAGRLSIPASLYEAAELDGAGSWRIFRRITVPSLKKFMGLAVLLRLIDSYKFIDTLFIMTNGGPGTASELPTLYIYVEAFQKLQLGRAAALSWAMTLLAIVGGMIFVRMQQRSGRGEEK
jgi:multiple sugar transport system permease protein